jgi:hypothetical protein
MRSVERAGHQDSLTGSLAQAVFRHGGGSSLGDVAKLPVGSYCHLPDDTVRGGWMARLDR